VTIDEEPFDQDMLFDLPARITGEGEPGMQIELSIMGETIGLQETATIDVRSNGTWAWDPESTVPALPPDTYTISGRMLDDSNDEVAATTPIQFTVELARSTSLQDSRVRLYTQPDDSAAFVLPRTTNVEVVGWQLVNGEEWYKGRQEDARALWWFRAEDVTDPLTNAEKESLPRVELP
jgi:hypothetical protein